jgi:hypothetical protein
MPPPRAADALNAAFAGAEGAGFHFLSAELKVLSAGFRLPEIPGEVIADALRKPSSKTTPVTSL